MRVMLIVCLLFGPSKMLFAQSQLEVVVKNIKNATGNIRVGVFKDAKTFLKKAAYGQVVKSQQNQITVLFSDLPPGTYAISIIHDENENGELDSGMFGIPKEGFGFANDAMGTFGPPSFEKASVAVETGKPTAITIQMRYL